MKDVTKSSVFLQVIGTFVLVIGALSVLCGRARGYSTEMRRAMVAGPWEIAVQIGNEGSVMSFPVKIADENKPEKLDVVLPVMGTPVEIKLERYIPDLQWETSIIKKDGGGVIAELAIKGPGLDQKFALDSGNPQRQSMTSPAGGVAIKRLYDPNKVEKLMVELVKPKTAGILSIRTKDSNSPLEYAVGPGTSISVPKSNYTLTVMEYVPHYQIDLKTMKVTSQSKKPVNPAIKVIVNDGKDTRERWLWSKIEYSPHQKVELPFRMKFTDFDLGGAEGHYILVIAPRSKPRLLSLKDGKIKVEQTGVGGSYLFNNKAYSFSIESITHGAVIKNEWKSNSEKLVSPAIIVTTRTNGATEEILLELNKPEHRQTDSETMVLLFRSQTKGR